jgi:hypothetical protein
MTRFRSHWTLVYGAWSTGQGNRRMKAEVAAMPMSLT